MTHQAPLSENTPSGGWLARFFKPHPGRLGRRAARKWRVFAAVYLVFHAAMLVGVIWVPPDIWVFRALVYSFGLTLAIYFYLSLLMPVLMSLKQLVQGEFSFLDLLCYLPVFLFALLYSRFVFDLAYVLNFFAMAYMAHEVRKEKMKMGTPAAQDEGKQKTA